MKTRFDDNQYWITAQGDCMDINDMETSHLMNTVRMLVQKPFITVNLLIKDIETFNTRVWTPKKKEIKSESIKNVTSMSEREVIEYILDTPLVLAMLTVLNSRGVNIENFVNMIQLGDSN